LSPLQIASGSLHKRHTHRVPFFAWQELVLARPWEFEDDFLLYEHVHTLLRPMLCLPFARNPVV